MGLFDVGGFLDGAQTIAFSSAQIIVTMALLGPAVSNPLTAVLAALSLANGVAGIGGGVVKIVNAFQDKTTWVPSSVNDQVVFSVAKAAGATDDMAQKTTDLINIASSIPEIGIGLAIKKETLEILSGIRNYFDGLTSQINGQRALQEAEKNGEKGYE